MGQRQEWMKAELMENTIFRMGKEQEEIQNSEKVHRFFSEFAHKVKPHMYCNLVQELVGIKIEESQLLWKLLNSLDIKCLALPFS